jgi:hypothetical protein
MTERFTDGGEAAAGYCRAVRRGNLGAAGNPGPANTMLYVTDLIGDGFLVEIEAQAVVLA